MMGRQRRGQERLFYEFCLDEVVPADHVVRRLDAVLDYELGSPGTCAVLQQPGASFD